MSIGDDIASWYMGLQKRIQASADLASLTGIFRLPVENLDTLGTGIQMHRMAIEMVATMIDDHATGLVVDAIDRFIREDLKIPDGPLASDPEVLSIASSLAANGFVGLPAPSQAILTATREHLDQAVPSSENGEYTPWDVQACPGVTELALDPAVVAVARRHLGAAPTVIELKARRVDAEGGLGRDEYFHVDRDDYQLCRQVVYLDDVDLDGGPLLYMRHTHQRAWIDMVRRGWLNGVADFDFWYLEHIRKTDREVRRIFHKPPVPLVGPAGGRFLVDPQGVYKLPRPNRGSRLTLSITYGVTPTRVGVAPLEPMPRTGLEPPLDYVGRLFWSQA